MVVSNQASGIFQASRIDNKKISFNNMRVLAMCAQKILDPLWSPVWEGGYQWFGNVVYGGDGGPFCDRGKVLSAEDGALHIKLIKLAFVHCKMGMEEEFREKLGSVNLPFLTGDRSSFGVLQMKHRRCKRRRIVRDSLLSALVPSQCGSRCLRLLYAPCSNELFLSFGSEEMRTMKEEYSWI